MSRFHAQHEAEEALAKCEAELKECKKELKKAVSAAKALADKKAK